MLQRGFGEKRGKDHHVWVYRKGEKPKQRGTGNFGVEKYFYGPEGSETDQKITDFENSIQGDIQDARSQPDGSELSADFAAPLIAHLEIRSNFLRSEVSNMTARLFSAIESQFGSPDRLHAMTKADLKSRPESLNHFLAKSLVPIGRREEASQLFDSYVANLPPEALAQLLGINFQSVFQSLALLPGAIKDGHNKAILAIEPDSPRVKALSEFAYSIYRPANGQLILPDTCAAFIGPKKVAPFTQKDDEIETLIVPISPEVAIVGRNGHQRLLELRTVNRLLAGCAYEAFVARLDDQTFASLARRIGKYAKMVSDREVKEMIAFDRMLSF